MLVGRLITLALRILFCYRLEPELGKGVLHRLSERGVYRRGGEAAERGGLSTGLCVCVTVYRRGVP